MLVESCKMDPNIWVVVAQIPAQQNFVVCTWIRHIKLKTYYVVEKKSKPTVAAKFGLAHLFSLFCCSTFY